MEGVYDTTAELPADWERKRLGDVLTVIRGASPRPKGDPRYFGGDIPWIMISDITREKGKFLSQTRDHVTKEGATKSRFLPPGTLILSNSGTVCVPKILAVDGCIHDGFVAFPELPSDFDILYLYYYFDLIRPRIINAHRQGITQVNLNTEIVKNIRLPIPPLDQQKRIVAEIEKQFSRLDEAVANLKRVKANLKRYKAAVLQAVTSGKLSASDEQTEDISEWRWLTIAELASPEPRSIQSGPFGSNLRHSEFQATGKLVIGIDNVRDGEFSLGSNHRISDEKFQELAKYAARPGDVLITVMATIGRVCVVPEAIEPAIITKHVYRITVDRQLAIPDYVAIALRGSYEVREQIMSSVQGQTRPGLNGGLIKKIRVPIPPLEVQQRIVDEVDRRLSILRETEVQVDANLQRAERLRNTVLAKSFSIGEAV